MFVGYAWLEYVAASRPIPSTFIVPPLIPLIERCASNMVTLGSFDYTAHRELYDTIIFDAAKAILPKPG